MANYFDELLAGKKSLTHTFWIAGFIPWIILQAIFFLTVTFTGISLNEIIIHKTILIIIAIYTQAICISIFQIFR